MCYCKRCILQNAILRGMIPLLLSLWCFGIAVQCTFGSEKLETIHEAQAQEFGLEEALVKVESEKTGILLFSLFGLLFVVAYIQFSHAVFFQRAKLTKSIMRYEQYEGEGDANKLLLEVDQDIAHGPVFESIYMGKIGPLDVLELPKMVV